MKIKILKRKKKSWEPFRSCLLKSTANQAQFEWKWTGLAVLFSRQLLNGSQDFFFRFSTLIFIYFFKYKTIETHARTFLPLNISAVGSVVYLLLCSEMSRLNKDLFSYSKIHPLKNGTFGSQFSNDWLFTHFSLT